MNEKQIKIIIIGNESDAVAEDIKKILQSELEQDFQITSLDKNTASKEGTKAIDPISVAALVIAIPGALLAAADLVERMKKRKKIDQSLEKINQRVQQQKQITVKMIYPDGTVKEITAVNSVEMIDQLSE